jgi:hypothetical protein
VRVTGLTANTVYNYYTQAGSDTSEVATFRTNKIGYESFRFGAYGDTRTNNAIHAEVVSKMHTYAPEFYIHSGDLVNSGGTASDWTGFFGALSPSANDTTFWPSIGNHERSGDATAWNYLNYFDLPNNEKWYSFNYSNAHFIALDTTSTYTNGSAQNNWLRADLDAADDWAEWIFVYFHHPPYSSSSHGSDLNVRNSLCWLFSQHNVTAVFNGHDHDYEHAEPGDGIHYFVVGAGGAPLYAAGTSWFTTYSESVHHFMIVDVMDNVTKLQAIRKTGTIMETIWIYHPDKRAPPAVPVTAMDTGKGGEVFVNWSAYQVLAPADLAEFKLYYSTTDFFDAGAMTPDLTFDNQTFTATVSGLTNGTTYYFAVVAADAIPNVNNTVLTASAVPSDITPPAVPTGLAVTEATEYTLNLTWNANIDIDLGGYKLFINDTGSGTGGPYHEIGQVGLQTFLKVTGLSQNTTYYFVLQALDLALPTPNNSTNSAEATGTTLKANEPPQVRIPLPLIETKEDSDPVFLAYDSVFWDPDGDEMFHSMHWSPELEVIGCVNGTGLDIQLWENYHGAGWLAISANDTEYEVEANITVTVEAVNDAPMLVELEDQEVYQYNYLNFTLNASDADIEDALEFTTNISSSIPDLVLEEWGLNETGSFWMHPMDQDLIGTEDEVDYSIAFWVTDDVVTVYSNITITIKNTNDPPEIIDDFDVIIVDANPNVDGLDNLSITVMVDEIWDPDGDKITYEWDFGDDSGTGAGLSATHTYAEAGIYSVTLTYGDREYFFDVTKTIEIQFGPDTKADVDDDGLDDLWELTHFENLEQTAEGDYDNDGYSNLEEYSNETDPTDPDDPEKQKPPVDDDDADATVFAISPMIILGIIGFVVIVIVILIVIVLLVMSRKKKQAPESEEPLQEPQVVPGPAAPDFDAAYQAPPPQPQPAPTQQLQAPEIPPMETQVPPQQEQQPIMETPPAESEMPPVEEQPPIQEEPPKMPTEEEVETAPPMDMPEESQALPQEEPVVEEDEEEDPFTI